MRRALIILQIWLFVLALSSLAFSQEQVLSTQKSITPFGRPGEVAFDAGKGKSYKYFRLVKGQSLGFAVEGPTSVEIRSRAGLRGPKFEADYQIQVWEGEYLAHADKLKSKLISAKIAGTNLLPANAEISRFETTAGVHNYRLWLVSDNIDTAFVRIFVNKPGVDSSAKISLWPLEYSKLVHLYSRKNQTSYYLIDNKKGVKVKLTGPLDLIVTARANFSADMLGRIGYSISVLEEGKELQVLKATTSKSLSMAYQDLSGVVPSQPSDFIVKIPAGTHIINFMLKESEAETISIRFSLPEQVD
jgi:hypothetical protein